MCQCFAQSPLVCTGYDTPFSTTNKRLLDSSDFIFVLLAHGETSVYPFGGDSAVSAHMVSFTACPDRFCQVVQPTSLGSFLFFLSTFVYPNVWSVHNRMSYSHQCEGHAVSHIHVSRTPVKQNSLRFLPIVTLMCPRHSSNCAISRCISISRGCAGAPSC